MEKTWRWFGRKDRITLDMLRQIGVEGIVTALHDVPNGDVWTYEAITELKNQVATLSIQIAEKVIRQQLSTDEKQKTLVNDLLKDVKMN